MKITVAAVGRPSRRLGDAIREYEKRARGYWKLDVVEVRAERSGRNRPDADVRRGEGERLLGVVPAGADVVALTRGGVGWSSEEMARYLGELAVRGSPGAAFLVGGALGLADEVLRRATHRLSLSPMTLPHDVARLVLVEQLYRAGTIGRGEPYHKG